MPGICFCLARQEYARPGLPGVLFTNFLSVLPGICPTSLARNRSCLACQEYILSGLPGVYPVWLPWKISCLAYLELSTVCTAWNMSCLACLKNARGCGEDGLTRVHSEGAVPSEAPEGGAMPLPFTRRRRQSQQFIPANSVS